jgi:hypothetical protein
MAKVIKNFNIDLSSMAAAGAARSFSVVGDNGAIFSLEVKNEDGYYYNFSTNTFAAAHKRLKNKRIDGGVYNGSITFPAVGDPDQYDIYLYAESMHDTVHAEYSEVRFGDGSLDINSSVGSSSNLLQKVIYQWDDVVATLSAISPSATHHGTGNFVSMAVSSDTITVGRGNTVGKTAFSIGITAAATKALQITRQPTINDLTAYATVTMGSGVTIPGEDIWAGTARSTDTTNGAVSSSSTVTMDTAVASKLKVGDRVTGTGISSTATVTVQSIASTYVFEASEAVEIDDEVTLTFTPPYYYRWSIDSSSSIHTLLPGMAIVDSDGTITSSTIGGYEDTTTYTTEIHNEDGSIEEVTNTVTNVSIPALDPLGYKPTIAYGLVTQQLGYITFNEQIINDLAGQDTYFYAHGPAAIKAIYNTTIKLTDLKVELTAPTTTTTADTSGSASATVAVADREGTVQNVSTVSGIGIASGAVNPTITSATADGPGNWTVDVAQALESGITLTVEGSSREATITGNIEFVNVDAASFVLRFDVEKFLTAS